MTAWTPVCRVCRRANPGTWSRCPHCDGVQVLDAPPAASGTADPAAEGLWRHRAGLPRVGEEISLGEGDTPLVRCPRLAGVGGVADLLVKNETANPTLSFKDRAMALGVSLARTHDVPGVVAASTGNTAVAAAAYAARAGLPCRIVCAADGPKPRLARSLGADVRLVGGDFSGAYATAAELEADGWFPLTTTFRNPYLTEAHRTVAFEIHERIGTPDWVIVPVGAGPLLAGIHHGFRALAAAGRADRTPRLVAVQTEACAPLAAAWAGDGTAVTAVRPGPTVAEAIADPLRGYEDEGLITLAAVRESGGTVVAVPDVEIVEAVRAFARLEGLSVEPAAAAPLAALRRLTSAGAVAPDARVVLVATGHGAKEPLTVEEDDEW
ncbi:pyridoxal-phosphate dependent enzyme [Actinoallomurus sp. NBC_01490]|uniref:pyridoxal-phosphate dependent enzyme n=1 Tax=Actinoallomurus sp. NBC_01490 TaxID=2903557 RepID=UPI002E30EDB3|nr:pyridoxal-phosphate dependent enzyme [Actinoallomurus sp. NBC_01490]